MAGPTVQFLGRLDDDEVRIELAGCRALIFPGNEDFGLTPLEAMASGRPVVAYGAGGALETVVEGETGMFFREQRAEALCEVLASFNERFDPEAIRAHALRFDKAAFKERLYDVLARRYAEYQDHLGRYG